jgi:hypothetical protein
VVSHGAEDAAAARLTFERCEQALLRAGSLSFEYEATVDGPLQAELAGSLIMTSHATDLRADGNLGAERIFVRLHADARHLSIRGAETTYQASRPPDLNGGLVLFLTRLGLLHLLVRLAHADPPPLARRAVARWLRVEPIAVIDAEGERSDLAAAAGIVLLTRLAGGEVGTGTLWVERENGTPRERTQGLHLPRQPLAVTELYRFGTAPGW